MPFGHDRIQAAALYCSDGRFGDQVDDLLHNALELPRYDRLVVPGGPACLAGHFTSFREDEAVMEQLRFLVTVHRIRQLVLIAHQDCAYYGEHLGITPTQIESRQKEDLARVRERLRGLNSDLQVQVFFARQDGGAVRFETFGA